MPVEPTQLPFSLAHRRTRRHANGLTALVASYREGGRWLSAVMDGVGYVRVGASRDDVTEAQVLADALAHPNCEGEGCGPWRAAPPFTEIRVVPSKQPPAEP